ncbi:response regulator transcription factor [Sansalvadorimonas verongulae]|uniref:response regulator transcription factor n=1 Tax=Sansalvadorimonas verongulae TaxID=2172824 RepID=UPI0012BCE690|nr:response regulator transcription factor [Sansalvadorimonas verongulae]MTI12538.1 response regulator transcription factor [Sansalvadorimonas verongulae]
MDVAIVEDNPDLRLELEFLLKHAGHHVSSFSCARLFYAFMEGKPALDIVVLDLGLPDEDGLSVAHKLKGTPGLGVVMLTARGGLSDRIQGFESGADIYLTKPVDVAELNAVMESIHRRIRVESQIGENARLQSSGRRLILGSGEVIDLTAAEGLIMKALAGSGFAAVSRKRLSEALGQDYMNYDERRLEAIVSRLRKKLKKVSPTTEFIKAARGLGYQLTVQIDTEV